MNLVFSCPKCSAAGEVRFSDEDIEQIRKAILENGRSPTVISRCENGHEVIITLYLRDDKLGIRDIATPLDTGTQGEEKKMGELDWLRKAFGG